MAEDMWMVLVVLVVAVTCQLRIEWLLWQALSMLVVESCLPCSWWWLSDWRLTLVVAVFGHELLSLNGCRMGWQCRRPRPDPAPQRLVPQPPVQ